MAKEGWRLARCRSVACSLARWRQACSRPRRRRRRQRRAAAEEETLHQLLELRLGTDAQHIATPRCRRRTPTCRPPALDRALAADVEAEPPSSSTPRGRSGCAIPCCLPACRSGWGGRRRSSTASTAIWGSPDRKFTQLVQNWRGKCRGKSTTASPMPNLRAPPTATSVRGAFASRTSRPCVVFASHTTTLEPERCEAGSRIEGDAAIMMATAGAPSRTGSNRSFIKLLPRREQPRREPARESDPSPTARG